LTSDIYFLLLFMIFICYYYSY